MTKTVVLFLENTARLEVCECARVPSREKLAKNELFNWLFWVKKLL